MPQSASMRPQPNRIDLPGAVASRLPLRGRIVAGVSGGADSLALLEALAAAGLGADRLIAVHVHHGLRGREADRDQAAVLAACRRLGVPCAVYRRDAAAEAARRGRSLEDAGREIRRECFLDAARAFGARAVVLAHHRDDLAETLLLNLLRGAAGRGLSGVRADRPFPHPGAPAGLRLLRPLLAYSKSELQDYLRTRGVAWREDRSNRNPAFARNRLRLRILPYLEQETGLPVTILLARSARILAREDDYLQALARAAAGRWPRPLAGRRLRWPRARLHACPPALRGRVLGLAWDGCGIPAKSAEHLDALAVLAPGAVRALPGGWSARASHRILELIPPAAPRSATPAHLFTGVGVEWRNVPVPKRPRSLRRGAERAVVDAAVLTEPLQAGPRRAGECMQPLGLGGRSKPLKKIMAEMRIPAEQRDRWPIIRMRDRVLWVFQGPVADWARVAPGTRKAVELRLGFPGGGPGKPLDFKRNIRRRKPGPRA